ncbi:MAG: Uma2 family endonuclease [Myxococcota bacterium]
MKATRSDKADALAAWAAWPEDRAGEWVGSAIEEEEVPTRIHEAVVAYLLFVLTGWARRHGARVYGSELKLAVSPTRGRKADVTVFLATTPRSAATLLLQEHPPHVAVEVVSASPQDARRDRIDKLAEYASFGVNYYWIVDPQLRTLEAYELTPDGRYAHALGASAGRESVPGLSSFSLDLDELWSEVDRELDE